MSVVYENHDLFFIKTTKDQSTRVGDTHVNIMSKQEQPISHKSSFHCVLEIYL